MNLLIGAWGANLRKSRLFRTFFQGFHKDLDHHRIGSLTNDFSSQGFLKKTCGKSFNPVLECTRRFKLTSFSTIFPVLFPFDPWGKFANDTTRVCHGGECLFGFERFECCVREGARSSRKVSSVSTNLICLSGSNFVGEFICLDIDLIRKK